MIIAPANPSTLTVAGATVGSPLIDLSTITLGSGTPTVIKANITSDNSGSGALLIDLQYGGTSRFKVRKDGLATIGNGLSVQASNTSTSGTQTLDSLTTFANPAGASTAHYYGNYLTIQYQSTSDTTGQVIGVYGYAELTTSGTANQTIGVSGTAKASGSGGAYGATASLYGGLFQAQVAGTSTFNHAIGIKINGPQVNGNTTFACGLYVQDMAANIGTGTVTGSSGIHIEASGAANAITFGNGGSTINAKFYSSAANVLDFAASSGAIFTGPVKTLTTTVASLPAAGTAGRRAFVTNANATTFASIVAGGGSNGVPVYDDGTNWRIG